MRPFADAWNAVEDIDGWLTEGQARMLYESAAETAPCSAIVEIGSHHGRSTIILGAGAASDIQLVAVDPFDDPRWGGGHNAFEVFCSNLARNQLDSVTLLKAYGAQAGEQWNGPPVDLLFLDGAHDYASVCADLEAWQPHLSKTATVLMHDAYSSPGVTCAAFRYMFASRAFYYRGCSRSLVRFDRRDGSRLLSCIRMLARLPWLMRNLTVKIARRRGWTAVERLLRHSDTALPY